MINYIFSSYSHLFNLQKHTTGGNMQRKEFVIIINRVINSLRKNSSFTCNLLGKKLGMSAQVHYEAMFKPKGVKGSLWLFNSLEGHKWRDFSYKERALIFKDYRLNMVLLFKERVLSESLYERF